jgi:hypothetical protein
MTMNAGPSFHRLSPHGLWSSKYVTTTYPVRQAPESLESETHHGHVGLNIACRQWRFQNLKRNPKHRRLNPAVAQLRHIRVSTPYA